jgi:deoxyribodipyrimidine photo-lyase
MHKRILVWFRNDLRIEDNEMLAEAVAKAEEILPVYIFDPRQFQETPFGTLKTGFNRAKFLLESVSALREQLGGHLYIAFGLPKDILPKLAEQHQITEVYHHREVANHETRVSNNVEDSLWKLQINLRHFIGHTLYNKEDLPFPIKDIPVDFLKFKKRTEREALVKPGIKPPENMRFVAINDWGKLPSLVDLHPSFSMQGTAQEQGILGGEANAWAELHTFIQQQNAHSTNKGNFSKNNTGSLLSSYLSLGCLSPRSVYWAMKDAEKQAIDKSAYHQVIVGLLWRDYYRFMLKKQGSVEQLIIDAKAELLSESEQKPFKTWTKGATANRLVNHILTKLRNTGFITYQERVLAAMYLVDELKVNWILGALYFEEMLVDYCPASNWGNWATLAGLGYNPQQKNTITFDKIAKLVDPKGELSTVVYF